METKPNVPVTLDYLVRTVLKRDIPLTLTLLSIDPGETTGWSYFQGTQFVDSGQIHEKTFEQHAYKAQDLLIKTNPNVVIVESYSVFSWKADQHIWSSLYTPQLIGALRLIAAQNGVKFVHQTPQQGKAFCTDDKLRKWGMYVKGQRHARDAIRHACTYLIFNQELYDDAQNKTKNPQ